MKKLIISLAFCFLIFLLLTPSVWAECSFVCCDPDNCINPHPETSPPYTCVPDRLCCESCGRGGSEITNPVIGIFGLQAGEITIATILATFLRISLVVAGILLLIYLVIGGFQWLTAGGAKESVASAKSRITNAFIGLLIIVFILVIINLINLVFHLDILRPEIPTPESIP